LTIWLLLAAAVVHREATKQLAAVVVVQVAIGLLPLFLLEHHLP
jgi:hypothetical protein